MRGYDLGIGSEIVDIECFKTGSSKRGSPLKFAIDAARSMANASANIGGSVQALTFGASANVPIGMAFGLLGAVLDNLPISYIHCRCDITGDRNANLGRLTATALGICRNQLGADFGRIMTGTQEITFRQNLADQVYTSVEMCSSFTSDALFRSALNTGLALNPSTLGIANIQAIATDAQNVAAGFDPGAVAMVAIFQRDSRRLITVPPPNTSNVPQYVNPPDFTIVASRQGDPGFNDNPPLLRGAFGTVPQTVLNQIPPPVRDGTAAAVAAVTAAAIPAGSIPAGIEHLIVQALLGQNQTPPLPGTLATDS